MVEGLVSSKMSFITKVDPSPERTSSKHSKNEMFKKNSLHLSDRGATIISRELDPSNPMASTSIVTALILGISIVSSTHSFVYVSSCFMPSSCFSFSYHSSLVDDYILCAINSLIYTIPSIYLNVDLRCYSAHVLDISMYKAGTTRSQ